jgi:hypothetical protein
VLQVAKDEVVAIERGLENAGVLVIEMPAALREEY